MNPAYAIEDASAVYTPALIFYKDLIRQNIARLVTVAGRPDRLRPHVKTHKTREIVQMLREAGVQKHKCATIAEAEMLALTGVPDVLLAYPMVGPNVARFTRLVGKHPATSFSVVVDHPAPTQALSKAIAAAGLTVDVLIDLDVGQHRTGIVPGDEALALYESLGRLPGLRPAGFHVYDGHNHQDAPEDRAAAARQALEPVLALRARALAKGVAVPRVVVGGTPTFFAFAAMDLPGLECSPGTTVLHDHGYGSHFRDLAEFTPAALLLTRVISKPTPTRLTFDLGYKAVASDPPAGQRLVLLDVPDSRTVLQNEEHLVVETSAADRFDIGAEVLAIPTHVCPTSALHRFAHVVEAGKVTGRWEIVGRDRMLSV